jgi:hypothetical protein
MTAAAEDGARAANVAWRSHGLVADGWLRCSREPPLPRSWSCRRLQTPGWAARTLLVADGRRREVAMPYSLGPI